MERIVVLHGHDLDDFLRTAAVLQLNRDHIWNLEFWIDTDGLKFKVNGGVWTAPLGEVEERP